jgi:hypothetical protein
MSVDDRGTHRSVEREHEDEGDARAQGRHRRGHRGSSPVSLAAVAEAEPLFSHDPEHESVLEAAIEPILDLAASGRTRRVVTIPSIDEPAAPAMPEPRLGMLGSVRRWWRTGSRSRAQAARDATPPLEEGPSPQTYAQAVRGVMTLTEERFQSLGLRSDRLQDELRAISRSMTELRRRAEESDRRLSERLATQGAELASALEGAVERIRVLVPDALDRLEERLHAMNERDLGRATTSLRETTVAELETFRRVASEHLDRVRWAIPAEVERARGASVEELVRIRTEIAALSRKVDEAIAGDPAFTSATGEGEDAAPR